MKKLILLLAITLIWGCSQANDSATENTAKEQANKAVQSAQSEVKKELKKEVNDAVAEQTAEAEKKAEKKAEAVAEKVADKLDHNHANETAAAADYQAGIHYNVITPAWDTGSDDVVVYEFFSYMCGHCNTFQPYMKKLESNLPEGIQVQRVPVVFYPQWKPYAQAYYTFEAMDLVEQAHASFFAAIHQHKKRFRDIEEVADWVAGSFNVDRDKFLSTANSFMVDGQIRKGMHMMQAMNVSSTPTLVVDGKFKPNNDQMRSRNDIIKVVEALAIQEAE